MHGVIDNVLAKIEIQITVAIQVAPSGAGAPTFFTQSGVTRDLLKGSIPLVLKKSVLSEVGLAAPVFDARGEVAGAIGVHGSIRNLWNDGQAKSELVDLVIDAARAISRDLGAERSRG